MIVRNYYEAPAENKPSHDGVGAIHQVNLFRREDFETRLRFIIYCQLQPGESIGYHQHGHNEEVYVVLEGQGTMAVNGERHPAKPGDVFVNKPEWSHGLVNDSQAVLKLLVFEVDGDPQGAQG